MPCSSTETGNVASRYRYRFYTNKRRQECRVGHNQGSNTVLGWSQKPCGHSRREETKPCGYILRGCYERHIAGHWVTCGLPNTVEQIEGNAHETTACYHCIARRPPGAHLTNTLYTPQKKSSSSSSAVPTPLTI